MTAKKNFEDLTPEDCKELKLEFAPGCFDQFEGTQEELDDLIAEITRLVSSGEILEKSVPVDELDEADIEFIENIQSARTLQ